MTQKRASLDLVSFDPAGMEGTCYGGGSSLHKNAVHLNDLLSVFDTCWHVLAWSVPCSYAVLS